MPRSKPRPLVAVVMGSSSDWKTARLAVETLKEFKIPCEYRIVSAHRTPDLLAKFGREAAGRGIEVIIACAGGAAHLPGMIASHTWLPVLGVPILSKSLKGIDSLLSIAQMPAGVPVGTLAIGDAGAKNAGLLAASIIGLRDPKVRRRVELFRKKQTRSVLKQRLS
jgi:5-(carboxyamino)imidazole ribonucleotide mutase